MMLKNWLFVYIGNFIGSIIVAAGCAYFGQMNYSGGGLAVFTMKLAATKASLPMGNAIVLGFFCNVLVCFAVLCSLEAKDVTGRIVGTFLPIASFVICGLSIQLQTCITFRQEFLHPMCRLMRQSGRSRT